MQNGYSIEITTFDVGKGDCHAILTPDGRVSTRNNGTIVTKIVPKNPPPLFWGAPQRTSDYTVSVLHH
jgi:hypothetical protein